MGSARSFFARLPLGGREDQLGWLSLTPEPERELPPVIAALRSEDPRGTGEALERERAAVEEIVLRGGERDWLAYLSEVVTLLLDSPKVGLSLSQRAAALEVLANHHRLLLGLPGDAAERTEPERIALERALSADGEDNQENRNGGP